MRLVVAELAFLVLATGLIGCSETSDEERLKMLVPNAQATIPVSGQVLVDGLPVKDIWVTLHPENETVESLLPKAQTDAAGNFQITTYISGDGAPQGQYKITIEWLTYRQFGSSWVGPSKLDGPCGNAKTTEYSINVATDPIILPTFEVHARSDADTAKPLPRNRRLEKKN